ncbi:Hcp family type VI secretion system effector, partial [Enterobacter hormaechei]|uniref:Hcp family type VI secretion system effector n=1 Tax=Enterobacter hormaechei TaxID=158836 RepID=UPI003D80A48B
LRDLQNEFRGQRQLCLIYRSYTKSVSWQHHRANGAITGTRQHSSMRIEKEVDSSTPYLYKAAATGQALKSAEIKFYHINDAGQEVCYYTVFMENVKVTGVNCSVPNVKIAANDKINHVESVSLQYEKITWRIVDGNIQHSDAWNERTTA